MFLIKRCPEHGHERVLIADDVEYYRRSREVFIKTARDAAAVQYADALGLPVRLRTVPRSPAALVPDAGRNHGPLQSAAVRSATRRADPHRPGFRPLDRRSSSCSTPWSATRAARRRADSPAASRRSTRSSSRSSTAARRAPIRHLMVNTNGIRIAQDREFAARLAEYMPGFEVYLQFDSFERDALMELRGADLPDIRERGARAAQRTRHFDHAGRHAEEGPQRRRDRRDHRLRAAAAVRARRHLAAGPGRRTARGLRSGDRSPDADRSAPPHSRADDVFRPEDVHPGALPSRLPRDGLRAEARRQGRAADRL